MAASIGDTGLFLKYYYENPNHTHLQACRAQGKNIVKVRSGAVKPVPHKTEKGVCVSAAVIVPQDMLEILE